MRRVAPLVDVLGVLVFVLIGRAHHDHGETFGGVVSTAWPFLLGLLVAWSAVRRTGRDGLSLRAGAFIALVTVVIGMTARVLAGQGTAPAFIAVALAFNGALMLAWRALGRWWGR